MCQSCFVCNLLGPCLNVFVFTQAKYLAQIIVMGAQVVGRAFARALRQEFAGRSKLMLYYVHLFSYFKSFQYHINN